MIADKQGSTGTIIDGGTWCTMQFAKSDSHAMQTEWPLSSGVKCERLCQEIKQEAAVDETEVSVVKSEAAIGQHGMEGLSCWMKPKLTSFQSQKLRQSARHSAAEAAGLAHSTFKENGDCFKHQQSPWTESQASQFWSVHNIEVENQEDNVEDAVSEQKDTEREQKSLSTAASGLEQETNKSLTDRHSKLPADMSELVWVKKEQDESVTKDNLVHQKEMPALDDQGKVGCYSTDSYHNAFGAQLNTDQTGAGTPCSSNPSQVLSLPSVPVSSPSSQDSTYNCRQCLGTFKTSDDLLRHMAFHAEARPFKCMHCTAPFKTSSDLSKHMVVHNDVRPYKCSKCTDAFKRASDLAKHMVVHSEVKPHKCSECAAAFRTPSQLKNHALVHGGAKPRHKCTLCPASFKTSSDLSKHMVVHNDARPFRCTECTSAFKRASDLAKHMVVHSDERPHKCGECAAAFKSICQLNRHMLVHDDRRPHKCSQCEAAFKLASHLKNHKLIHSDARPHKCSECLAAFKKTTDLLKHMLVHSNVRPYKCSQCAAAFKTVEKLKLHKLVHSDIRPYSCDQCSASFKMSSYLKQHMLVHSEARSHTCSECLAPFKTAIALKKHWLVHGKGEASLESQG